MVQDVRSSSTGFDLLTQEGVMRALAWVRGSTATADTKRELRDLIFSYTNAGGDPALRTLIESQLATLAAGSNQTTQMVGETPTVAAMPVMSPQSVVAAPQSQTTPPSYTPTASVPLTRAASPRAGFGSGRPAPQFAKPNPTPAPVLKVPVISVPPTATSVPSFVPATSTPITATSQIVSSVPTPTPTPVPVVESPLDVIPHKAPMPLPTPDPAPVPMVAKAVVDEKLAPVAPVSEPTIEYKPPYREDVSLEGYRARIAEIKQSVNTKVGNPVNLVDMDDTIGRSYMTALLEAMKAASGGGGDIVALMARLEAVLIEVEALLQTKDASALTISTETPASLPVYPSTTELTSIEPDATSSYESYIPPVEVEENAVQSVSIPVTETDVVPISPMTIASSRFKNVLPLTEQEPLKTPADLPTAAEMKARAGITDPLQDPDVDLGLEQLLAEWTLFKKSGMFGTGPKSRQHPLFLKLATIPMPLILSGRFEGSSNEIRQSITDYMNGWRYEQGIIYEQDETFEHYLRRVIRHIIDSQTRRRGA